MSNNYPSNPNQPPPQWQGQPFNPQSGQYPPVPQQGYPQSAPQQNYQQFPQGYQQPMMQPPQTPPKKRRTGLMIAGIIAAVLVFGCIGASLLASHSGATTATTTSSSKVGNTTGTTPTAIPTQASAYKVGDVVKVGDSWDVTVVSAKTDPGNDVFKPTKSGDTYLVITLAMKNLTTENHSISSIIQFTLRSDDGTKYTTALYTPDGTSAIDGDVDGGQPAKGSISYEVPSNVHSFHLTFENVVSAGRATWNLNV